MKIRYIVLLVAIINMALGLVISFVFGSSAKISRFKTTTGDPIGTYILPGFMGPEAYSYTPFVEALSGEVKFVHYNNFGFNIQVIAAQIVEDIKASGYATVQLLSVSMGDKIAQCVAAQYGESVTIYALNPCTQTQCVKASVRRWINPVTTQALRVVKTALGLLSYLPLAPKDGQTWSFAALVEQVSTIACESPPIISQATAGVVLCQPSTADEDDFLDNAAVRTAFQAPVITLDGYHHADIVGSASAYLDALRTFGLKSPF